MSFDKSQFENCSMDKLKDLEKTVNRLLMKKAIEEMHNAFPNVISLEYGDATRPMFKLTCSYQDISCETRHGNRLIDVPDVHKLNAVGEVDMETVLTISKYQCIKWLCDRGVIADIDCIHTLVGHAHIIWRAIFREICEESREVVLVHIRDINKGCLAF